MTATSRRRRTARTRATRHGPDVSLLRSAAMFEPYGAAQLAPLTPHADRVVLLPGAALALEGRRPHEVVVILSGDAVEISAGTDVGRLGAGAVIGAAEELAGTALTATVVAAGPVAALVLRGPALRWAARTLPGFSPVPGLAAGDGAEREQAPARRDTHR